MMSKISSLDSKTEHCVLFLLLFLGHCPSVGASKGHMTKRRCSSRVTLQTDKRNVLPSRWLDGLDRWDFHILLQLNVSGTFLATRFPFI